MFQRQVMVVLILILAGLTCLYAADVTGKWNASFDSQVGPQKYVFDLKSEGTKVTGKAISDIGGATTTTEITEGVLEGDQISFVENLDYQGMELKIEYKGTVSGDEMKLSRTVAGQEGETFVAKREK